MCAEHFNPWMLPGETAYSIVDYGGAELIEAKHPKREGRELLRRGVMVCGIVQGVGFRPFVYRLATEEGLAGSIGNDTDGVSIEVEGPPQKIEAFLSRLRIETPPLARISDSVFAPILSSISAITTEAPSRAKTREIPPPMPAPPPVTIATLSLRRPKPPAATVLGMV